MHAQPKLKEAVGKRAKMVAKFVHENLTWKKILMSWMVLLVASKMVLLMLTYEFFSLTALISLQVSPERIILSNINKFEFSHPKQFVCCCSCLRMQPLPGNMVF